jgi:hypothetical protein
MSGNERPPDTGQSWASLLMLMAAILVVVTLGWAIEMIPD